MLPLFICTVNRQSEIRQQIMPEFEDRWTDMTDEGQLSLAPAFKQSRKLDSSSYLYSVFHERLFQCVVVDWNS